MLMCCNGHPLRKKKALRWYQRGTRSCDGCNLEIYREEPRWRCRRHCDYDICESCYETARTPPTQPRDEVFESAEPPLSQPSLSQQLLEVPVAAASLGTVWEELPVEAVLQEKAVDGKRPGPTGATSPLFQRASPSVPRLCLDSLAPVAELSAGLKPLAAPERPAPGAVVPRLRLDALAQGADRSGPEEAGEPPAVPERPAPGAEEASKPWPYHGAVRLQRRGGRGADSGRPEVAAEPTAASVQPAPGVEGASAARVYYGAARLWRGGRGAGSCEDRTGSTSSSTGGPVAETPMREAAGAAVEEEQPCQLAPQEKRMPVGTGEKQTPRRPRATPIPTAPGVGEGTPMPPLGTCALGRQALLKEDRVKPAQRRRRWRRRFRSIARWRGLQCIFQQSTGAPQPSAP